MDTAAIRYRVADFLKQHPPFTAIADADLVTLAASGRVRFYEPNEFLLWQGEPHKAHVYVIQQGTVSLWDERQGKAELRDVRGAGDLLGAEQFHGARSVLYSARSTSDVVVYGLPAGDFAEVVAKYAYVREFVAALGSVAGDFKRTEERADPRRVFLHERAGPLLACRHTDSVANAARLLTGASAEGMAVIGNNAELLGVVTPRSLLAWIAEDSRNVGRPLSELPLASTPALGPDASIADGAIAVGTSETGALAMTSDGTCTGQLLAVLTPGDLAPVFGDQPAVILRDIGGAADVHALRSLNQRARACALRFLTSATATEWVSRFTDAADLAIIRRLITLTGAGGTACWCVCGAAGRGESIVPRQPHVVVIHDGAADIRTLEERFATVMKNVAACGYLPAAAPASDPAYSIASASEWTRRYTAWVQNPVIEDMSRHRSLFDLRPFHGARAVWQSVRDRVARIVDRDIIRVLAHDCLASLPPLTFYQDGVVEQSGEQTAVFRLEHNVLGPLIDLGRVLGMAGRDVMGTSTADRFAMARRLLPAHEAIFRDATETLRIVLWQQGRIGISQRTDGAELPPSLLSRHDRHVLKSGFPVIQRLLEFTADSHWLDEI